MPGYAPHRAIKYGFDINNPPSTPPGQSNGHFLPSFDNRLWLFYRSWLPPAEDKVRGTLMIAHGTVDRSCVYVEMAEKLAKESGTAVFAMDMRGWGLSDGESMYYNDRETFVKDVNHFYQHIHNQEPYSNIKSRFLMGKSLGGTISAFCVKKYPQHWTGWIGLSGAFQLGPNFRGPSAIAMGVLDLGATFVPKVHFRPLFDVSDIVADPQAQQEWRDDKLCCKDKLTFGYCREALSSLQALASEEFSTISDVPTLMLCGEEDKVVTLEGHQAMLDKTTHSDKKLIVYPKGKHNLLQEPSIKKKAMDDIQGWVNEHLAEQ